MTKETLRLSPLGFREYDARWIYPDDINLAGMKRLGLAFGIFTREARKMRQDETPRIICGYDYRSYSEEVAQSFSEGLLEAGAQIHDIGLALSPMAYFAQAALGAEGVAMVTASHNPNGWTGVKMGVGAPLTLMGEEMEALKEKSLGGALTPAKKRGAVVPEADMRQNYIDDLCKRPSFSKPIRIVLDCGNGTAGFFAAEVFRRLGADVIELHCDPDFTFPHYNPNPEEMAMMDSLGKKVREAKADLGLAFDGDGDRCGFADEKGAVISADKAGLLIAQAMATKTSALHFIADVKSTGLYEQCLRDIGASVEYWKTGHSYMKQRLHQKKAAAAFEKSGHFFFNPPLGKGYDDGLLSGILFASVLCEKDMKASALLDFLPRTWISPTLSLPSRDEKKYEIVEKARGFYKTQKEIAGRAIEKLIEVNGVRVVLEDGSWLLVRASSNVPSLVVVAESTQSQKDMEDLVLRIEGVLQRF